MTLTQFLIGSSLSLATLRKVSWKPLAQGTLLWLAISLAALQGVRFVP